jgi:hypothetical protein
MDGLLLSQYWYGVWMILNDKHFLQIFMTAGQNSLREYV